MRSTKGVAKFNKTFYLNGLFLAIIKKWRFCVAFSKKPVVKIHCVNKTLQDKLSSALTRQPHTCSSFSV